MGYNLTQINPAYELVGEVIVSSATTIVDFTGLNFGKEDDLMIKYTYKNNGTAASMRVFVNNNTTLTNYYSQGIYADGAVYSGGRYNGSYTNYASNSGTSFSTLYLKLTNNGYITYLNFDNRDVGGSSTSLDDRFGSSTFTASSITQITFSANVSNAIGIGSRFQLYKRVAPIIADIIVSSATTSVDITGLSIDKGSEYQLVFDVSNNSGSGQDYSIFYNGNTTPTNYYCQTLYVDNTIIIAARNNNHVLFSATNANKNFSIMSIKLTNNGYIISQINSLREYGVGLKLQNVYGTSTFTATSITQLTITASVANGIGVGSRFQLIKLK